MLPAGRNYAPADLDLFNLLIHPVWVFDIERKCMYWANKSALKLWHADSLESLLSRDFKSDMTEATRIKMDDQLLQLRAGEVLSEQWTMYPQNRPTTVDLTGSAIHISDGRVAALMEAEISKSRYDESTVRGIELLRQLPLPVFQFRTEGKLMYRNPEAVRIYGGEKEFLGHFVDKVLGEKCFEQAFRGVDYNVEAEHFTSDRSKRWFSVSVRRARDPVSTDSKEYVILMIARDITEVLQARKDSAAAKVKAEFLAILAHDIRTPLHQIIGYVDVLVDVFRSSALEPELKDQLHLLQVSASSLMGITNDLLDYSKIESGQLRLDAVSFELLPLITWCAMALKNDAEEKGLRLNSSARDLPSRIFGDPNQLRRILYNLVENAIKYTSVGQVSLTASVFDQENVLVFEVSDTGMGIDKSQQQAIFEKYIHTQNYGGTGLGLTICQGLVEAMGGTISVRSEVGRGSTFVVKIPLKLPDDSCIGSELHTHSKTKEEEKPLRILVAEDNKINQKVARAMLQKIGHSVTIAENGKLAIDALTQGIFDLVLMDKMMPVMDGIEATKAIRTRLGLSKANLPIVGLTASFQNSDLEYYQECGMNYCMAKPVKLAVLQRVIAEVVKEHKST